MGTFKNVRVNLKRENDDSYDIVIGSELFPEIAEYVGSSHAGKRVAIITDSNLISSGHAGGLTRALQNKGLPSILASFPAGERSKTFETCVGLLNDLLGKGCGRDTVILALGGGVVGDMAGLVAALLNRGVPYVQIPTTTLAQADSSIGGKTGVDTVHGKNLVGVFKQPVRVFIDVKTLQTLPEKEYVSGLAETIKHGVILDEAFFAFLESHVDKIKARDTETLLQVACNNCGIKGSVVERDPHEKGLRRVLNYGHTIGHALEKEMNFTTLHGENVAIGMMVAGKIAEIQYGFRDLARQEALLQAVGLPTKLPGGISRERLLESAAMDKKALKSRARYSLPEKIGKMLPFDDEYATTVDDEVVVRALDATR